MDFFITLEIVFWLYLVLGPALPSMGQGEEYYLPRFRWQAGHLKSKAASRQQDHKATKSPGPSGRRKPTTARRS